MPHPQNLTPCPCPETCGVQNHRNPANCVGLNTNRQQTGPGVGAPPSAALPSPYVDDPDSRAADMAVLVDVQKRAAMVKENLSADDYDAVARIDVESFDAAGQNRDVSDLSVEATMAGVAALRSALYHDAHADDPASDSETGALAEAYDEATATDFDGNCESGLGDYLAHKTHDDPYGDVESVGRRARWRHQQWAAIAADYGGQLGELARCRCAAAANYEAELATGESPYGSARTGDEFMLLAEDVGARMGAEQWESAECNLLREQVAALQGAVEADDVETRRACVRAAHGVMYAR